MGRGKQMKNIWKDGIMGVVTGDALGCPVQFESRKKVAKHPVTDMRGYGVFNLPAGSWTDDSSLTLALLDSIRIKGAIDLDHIMGNFIKWLDNGEFTPYGYAYDIGNGTMWAIRKYKLDRRATKCGGTEEWNNGNGSLMRIMPVCLFAYTSKMSDEDAIKTVHQVASLTHAHIRANIACGLYYFMVKAILDGAESLPDKMQAGLTQGFAYYEQILADHEELKYYDRLRDLAQFASLPDYKIRSTGYVVDTLEAAVWSLITTTSFETALLKAVNLGDDTDTVGAVAGGLGGLFYGYQGIPAKWLNSLQKKDWIEKLCDLTING